MIALLKHYGESHMVLRSIAKRLSLEPNEFDNQFNQSSNPYKVLDIDREILDQYLKSQEIKDSYCMERFFEDKATIRLLETVKESRNDENIIAFSNFLFSPFVEGMFDAVIEIGRTNTNDVEEENQKYTKVFIFKARVMYRDSMIEKWFTVFPQW